MTDVVAMVGIPVVFLVFARGLFYSTWETHARHRYVSYLAAFCLFLVGLVAKFEWLFVPALVVMLCSWIYLEVAVRRKESRP